MSKKWKAWAARFAPATSATARSVEAPEANVPPERPARLESGPMFGVVSSLNTLCPTIATPVVSMPLETYLRTDRYVVRHNGRRLLEIYQGVAHSASPLEAKGEVRVVRPTVSRTGDTFTLERAPGIPGTSTAGSIVVASKLVPPATPIHLHPDGEVYAVSATDDRLVLALSARLFKSYDRVVIRVNGRPIAETYGGISFCGSAHPRGDGVRVVVEPIRARDGDPVIVELVRGVPGDAIDPSSAVLLASTIAHGSGR